MKHFLATLLIAAAVLAGCKTGNDNTQTDMGNQTIQNIMERRSIRHYTDRQVSRDTLQKLAELGVNAPNGMNKQEWALRIVDDPAYLDGVTALMKEEMPFFVNTDDPGFRNGFRNAPAVIFIGGPQEDAAGMNAISIGALCENICIAARSMGLGSIIMGGPSMFIGTNEAARPYLERLNLPEGYKLYICVGVGYADETPDAKPRDLGKIEFVD